MKRFLLTISGLILAAAAPALAQTQVHVTVDVIPPSARFVISARLDPEHPTIDDSEAAVTGAGLGEAVDALSSAAEQRGANLVVLLGSDHGVRVPISRANTFIMLRRNNPVVTALLLHYDDTTPITPAARSVRVTTQPPPADKDMPNIGNMKKMNISIPLKSMTPGLTLDGWVYFNLPRFYSMAAKAGFDTISIASTRDATFQEVWLPHCDEPLKVSRTKPILEVTIYRMPPAARSHQ